MCLIIIIRPYKTLHFFTAPSMLASEADITIPQFSTIPSSATHNIQTHLISPELLVGEGGIGVVVVGGGLGVL